MMRLIALAACLAMTSGAALAQDAAPPAAVPAPAPAADPTAVPPPAAVPEAVPPTASPSGAPATTNPPAEITVPEPPPAAGETPAAAAFDPAPLQSCLDAAAEPGPRYACIGTAAQACLEQPGNENTVGQSECLGAELDWWKSALNETYDTLYAQHQTTDAEIGGLPGAVAQAPLLEAGQKAWLAYRDAECAYQQAFFAGGSAGGPAAAGCEMDLTGRRAIDLMASVAAAETR